MTNKIESRIILICILVIIFSILAFFIIRAINKTNNVFIFNEHLADVIVTYDTKNTSSINVDSNSTDSHNNDSDNSDYSNENGILTLKDISYYVLVMEASVNHCAELYNPNNINSYWNIYINNTFVKSLAKENSLEICIRDNIYYEEALKNNITLNDNELSIVEEETSFIYGNLTGKQFDATELDKEDIYNARYKITMATKYITTLIENKAYSEEDLNTEGDYYKTLYDEYNISIDKSIWNEVKLGNITVN